jgi:hypothetical protein
MNYIHSSTVSSRIACGPRGRKGPAQMPRRHRRPRPQPEGRPTSHTHPQYGDLEVPSEVSQTACAAAVLDARRQGRPAHGRPNTGSTNTGQTPARRPGVGDDRISDRGWAHRRGSRRSRYASFTCTHARCLCPCLSPSLPLNSRRTVPARQPTQQICIVHAHTHTLSVPVSVSRSLSLTHAEKERGWVGEWADGWGALRPARRRRSRRGRRSRA